MTLENIVVVLVRSEGPLNVGSVARACGNFGAKLRLVDVRVDVRGSDAQKMAHPSEALLLQAGHFATLQEALDDVELAVATSSKIAAAAAGPALDLARAQGLRPRDGVLALVFGNERAGLALAEAALCQRVVRLPTRGPSDSMNLSHAVMCALTVFSLAAEGEHGARASAASREELLSSWSAALERAGFYRAGTAEAFAPRLRELVGKLDVSERDIAILRGMFTLFRERCAPASSSDEGAPPTNDGPVTGCR